MNPAPTATPDLDTLDDAARVAAIAERSPDLLVAIDPQGCVRWASSAALRILDTSPDDHVGAQSFDFLHPDDLAAAGGAVAEASRREGYHLPVVVRVRHADGTWVPCEVNGNTIDQPDGPWLVLAMRAMEGRTEVIVRRQDLDTLIQRVALDCARTHWVDVGGVVEAALGSLAAIVGAEWIELAAEEKSSGLEVTAWWSSDGRRGPSTGAGGDPGSFCSLLPAELAGIDPLGPVPAIHRLADLPPSTVRQAMVAHGLSRAVELPIPAEHRAVLRVGFAQRWLCWDDANVDLVRLLAAVLLSTQRRCEAEQQLHERARRDPLTGLLNGVELMSELAGRIEDGESRVGLLYGDLDWFKEVNDSLGHAEGDNVLVAVAEVLVGTTREGDLVARVGGDEFVVVVGDADEEAMEALTRRIDAALSRSLPVGARTRLSMGWSLARPRQDPVELLTLADQAMFRAKRETRRPPRHLEQVPPSA